MQRSEDHETQPQATDEPSTPLPAPPDALAAVEQDYHTELRRVRAERDEALLRLLELEQEIAKHVCGADSSQTQTG